MKGPWLAGLLLLTVAGAAPAASLVLEPAHVSHSLAVTGEPVTIWAELRNNGALDVEGVVADLYLPPSWRSDPYRIQLPVLAPYTSHRLVFRALAAESGHGGGRIVVTATGQPEPLLQAFPLSSCRPLNLNPVRYSMANRNMAEVVEDGMVYVTTGAYTIFLPLCGAERGPGLVYVRREGQWDRVATFPAMGRLAYEDDGPVAGEKVVAEHWVFPTTWWIPRDPAGDYLMTLKEQWTDFRGRRWMAKAWFGPTADPRVIKCTHAFMCSAAVKLHRFEGPMLSVGDGTFGTAHGGYLAPGSTEPGSEPTLLIRRGSVADGVMAVEHPAGGVMGVLWDPGQLWTSGKANPLALFALPNALYRRDNSYLSLVAPHFGPGQAPDARLAEPPLEIPGNRPVYLRTEIYVSAGGTVQDAARLARERRANGAMNTPLRPPLR